MSKRIITTYKKLSNTVKKAIHAEYPHGIEHQLTEMKHVIKGYLFDGFVFEHENVTYLVEWSKIGETTNFKFQDVELEDELEGIDLEEDEIKD